MGLLARAWPVLAFPLALWVVSKLIGQERETGPRSAASGGAPPGTVPPGGTRPGTVAPGEQLSELDAVQGLAAWVARLRTEKPLFAGTITEANAVPGRSG